MKKPSEATEKLKQERARRQRLQQQYERLERENERLRQQKKQLEEKVEELQRELARQAAPFRRRPAAKIAVQKQKRPGCKGGHAGRYRRLPKEVDRQVEVPLEGCPRCGEPVQQMDRVEQYIEEIAPLRPQVLKLITYRARCRRCGPIRSLHPLQTSTAQGAARVQLGPRALAVAALLNKSHGLTLRKTCQVLQQLMGLQLTAGGLCQALHRMADKVQPEYNSLRQQLRNEPAVFVDETSWWVGEPGWWLWVHTSPRSTLYQVESSRGSGVVQQTLGSQFRGTLVSDCLASYDPLPYSKHKCIAHHLRAIAQARDRPDSRDPTYLHQWALFFKTVMVLHGESGKGSLPPQRIRNLEKWRDRLLAQAVTQPGDRIIQNRLSKQRVHLLGCLYQPAAEPTNNRAERALRPAVIARKLSCGNKTQRGKQTWEILASLAATCRQRDVDFVDFLSGHLALVNQQR